MQAVGTASLGVALLSFVGNAWAEDICARAQDLTALQTAAVQQELMVAAYACNDSGLYNTFVVTFQRDLQASDTALQAYFLRLNPASGTADYHSYKTRLANTYALRTASNTGEYCRRALTVFRSALNENKQSLAAFVLAQPMAVGSSYRTCGESVPGGAMVAKINAPALAAPPMAQGTRAITAREDDRTLVTPAPDGTALPAPVNNSYASNNPGRPAADPYRAAPSGGSAGYPYDSRDPYARPPSGSYGTSTYYGERDPYYRDPYDRYWYGAVPPGYYVRRR